MMDKANIVSINRGAVEEIFQECLSQAVANIRDNNTDPKATRSFSLRFDLKPHDDGKRQGIDLVVTPTVKLPSVRASRGQLFIGPKNEVFTHNPAQEVMFQDTPASERKV